MSLNRSSSRRNLLNKSFSIEHSFANVRNGLPQVVFPILFPEILHINEQTNLTYTDQTLKYKNGILSCLSMHDGHLYTRVILDDGQFDGNSK